MPVDRDADVASRRKVRTIALVGLLAGAVVALLASTQVWVDAALTVSGLPPIDVQATGRVVAPLVPAVALLALGGAAALLLVGGIARRVVGAVIGAMALLAIVSAARAALDPSTAVAPALAEAAGITGLPEALAPTTDVTGWPWIATAGLLLTLGAGALAALSSRWPDVGRRYATQDGSAESPGAAKPAAARDDGVGLWDALDRGDDPTA
jgi:uncharacterized membrane protein (TIGR02234 family)